MRISGRCAVNVKDRAYAFLIAIPLCLLTSCGYPAEQAVAVPVAATPRFEYNATGGILRDIYGNAAGGLRLSHHHVATAVNNRINSGGAVCTVSGHHQPFDSATLKLLYPTQHDYLMRVEQMTAKNLVDGYLLPADAEATLQQARTDPRLH